jgi:hypothetical protein
MNTCVDMCIYLQANLNHLLTALSDMVLNTIWSWTLLAQAVILETLEVEVQRIAVLKSLQDFISMENKEKQNNNWV